MKTQSTSAITIGRNPALTIFIVRAIAERKARRDWRLSLVKKFIHPFKMNTPNEFATNGCTVKDAHSPSGQHYYSPPNLADLPDCPKCKYGTPVEKDGKMVCIDCGEEVPK
jgi:hypothetical protein